MPVRVRVVGLARHQHTSAAAEVKVTMGLRAGSIALLGPTYLPTNQPTYQRRHTFSGALRLRMSLQCLRRELKFSSNPSS